MDWLRFTASVIDSLAWPAVVVLLLVLVRGQLQALVGRLAKLTIDGSKINAEFHKQLEAAATRAEELSSGAKVEELAAPTGSDEEEGDASSEGGPQSYEMEFPYQDFVDEMSALAEVSPSAAIGESYARLEAFIRSNLARHDIVETEGRPLRELTRTAEDRKILSDLSVSVLDDLSRLRNVVVHDRGSVDLSLEEAIKFAGMARAVAFDLAMRLSRSRRDVALTM